MASPRPAQVAIRSDYVRRRTDELVRKTGMTATRIIEEALAHYVPPVGYEQASAGLVWNGRVLVATGGRPATAEQVQASIDEDREGLRD